MLNGQLIKFEIEVLKCSLLDLNIEMFFGFHLIWRSLHMGITNILSNFRYCHADIMLTIVIDFTSN